MPSSIGADQVLGEGLAIIRLEPSRGTEAYSRLLVSGTWRDGTACSFPVAQRAYTFSAASKAKKNRIPDAAEVVISPAGIDGHVRKHGRILVLFEHGWLGGRYTGDKLHRSRRADHLAGLHT